MTGGGWRRSWLAGSADARARSRITVPVAVSGIVAGCLAVVALPASAPAQLRPLDPLEWRLFDRTEPARIELGVGFFDGQRASLAGVQGRLWELGVVHASWRTGRLLLEASGTALRGFQDQAMLAEPAGGARAGTGHTRWDAGDWEVTTAVRLTPRDAFADLVLRFGTRLPTTDNGVGLERDEIDFFALVGGRWQIGPLSVSAESGLGIHGTRDPEFEQSDLWLYAMTLEYQHGWFAPRLALIGQTNGLRSRVSRGTEELSELRFSVRAGQTRWLEISLVHGLTEFSPPRGLLIGAGMLISGGDAPEAMASPQAATREP